MDRPAAVPRNTTPQNMVFHTEGYYSTEYGIPYHGATRRNELLKHVPIRMNLKYMINDGPERTQKLYDSVYITFWKRPEGQQIDAWFPG